MESFYIYIHQRNDTGQCFYVGKGKGNRYKDKTSRNKHWHNIVNKVGYTSQILINGLTESKSLELEKEMIKQIGIDNLANMTEGGEGVSGFNKGKKHSDEFKKNISEKNTGQKRSDETKKNISKSLLGKKHSLQRRQNNSNGQKGKKMSDDFVKKIRLVHKSIFKSVKIDDITYICIGEAARQLNLGKGTLKYRLKSKNFTNYEYGK